MKLLLLLLLTTSLFARIDSLKELNQFTSKQLEVLNISYMVGEQYDLGIDLAAICIVENTCKLTDNNPNHIVGPHQIDADLHNLSKQALESDPYYSAKSALQIFLSYKYEYGYDKSTNTKYIVRERSIEEMHMIYNAGFKPHKFNKQHLAKINKAKQILKEYFK